MMSGEKTGLRLQDQFLPPNSQNQVVHPSTRKHLGSVVARPLGPGDHRRSSVDDVELAIQASFSRCGNRIVHLPFAELSIPVNVALTPFRTFTFAAIVAYFGGFALLFFMTSGDFPNSPAGEILRFSLLPPIPAALICGASARHYVHRNQLVEKLEWPVTALMIGGCFCAIAAVAITMVGAIVLGVLGWAFATPP